MEIIMKIALFMCVFSWIQAEKIFVDYNGNAIKVPTKRITPLDDKVWAQAVLYSAIGFIVVFMMWLSVHDTESTLLVEYSTDGEFLETRKALPEKQPSRSFTKGGGVPCLCTRHWHKGQNRIFSVASRRPQLVPQLSNWLIPPPLSPGVTGVEALGNHAGMPVVFQLPIQVPEEKTESGYQNDLKCDALYGGLAVQNKERSKRLSNLSSIEISPSCAAKLEPCHRGILLPNKFLEKVPSGGAPQHCYTPPQVLRADCADYQPQYHGLHGLFRVSWIMEGVRGLIVSQPVPMVLSSFALSFAAYKLLSKCGSR